MQTVLPVLPLKHLLGILEDILESVDEGNNVAEVNCSVIEAKVDGKLVAYNDDVVAVFVLLNNGFLHNRTVAANKYLRRND